MLITVKNLQQQTFSIEFEPQKTVLELKKAIFNVRGADYVVEKQKLIYAGVILTDERTINSYKVDEKKFIVVMLTRDISSGTGSGSNSRTDNKTDVAVAGPSNQQIQRSSTDVLVTEKSTVQKSDEPNALAAAATNTKTVDEKSSNRTASDEVSEANREVQSIVADTDYSSIDLAGELANASIQTRAESNLLMGVDYNRTVTSMVEMGYPREQVERAMAASFNNPERAVEYLINGIPLENNIFNPSAEDERESHLSQVSGTGAPVDSSADPFEFLRSQPQFLQMRSLIYQNPHLLHAVLQQIGQTNPALLQLISENQDAFLNMLNQPLEGEVGDNAHRTASIRSNESMAASTVQDSTRENQRSVAGSAIRTVSTNASEGDGLGLGTTERERNIQSENPATFRLTPQDQDAIERLKAMGFPEGLVLQAYFACEKDEELAANFLLSSSFDD
ncbi:Rad23 [Drosophila busckii]|uniref:UV excision repair protein RAD23 n=1 Tax=Drosophila busckii TaxID=30019 RepID=A0A0M4EL76_DROBS|nr:UV excision repair protein RAD23 homolog A [Drosophila busckii]ALC48121.1 Rad23 [Drosophila busckii]